MKTIIPNESPLELRPLVDRLRTTLQAVLCGKDDVVELVVTSLLARGHLLIEDLPGLGKTTLAKSIARAIGGKFSRVQCTPDLLPTDITGLISSIKRLTSSNSNVARYSRTFYSLTKSIEQRRERKARLFEAMAERQVTIDRDTHPLSAGFFVIATQNPIDSHGTYPLPEAQLDRFAVKLSIGYPNCVQETRMLGEAIQSTERDRSEVEEVLSVEQLQQLQQHVAAIEVTEKVRGYIVTLGKTTREHSEVHVGLSPRGLLMWQRLAQAHAYLASRDFVTPDDVQAVAQPALSVRLTGNFDSAKELVAEILSGRSDPLEIDSIHKDIKTKETRMTHSKILSAATERSGSLPSALLAAWRSAALKLQLRHLRLQAARKNMGTDRRAILRLSLKSNTLATTSKQRLMPAHPTLATTHCMKCPKILDVLPEVAAETDLPKEDWQVVKDESKNLFDQFMKIHDGFHGESKQGASFDSVADEINNAIEILESKVAATGEKVEADHDHDHDHEHDHEHEHEGHAHD